MNETSKKKDKIDADYTRSNFPSLMRSTRMLLIDYDLTRYHSFELFSYLLLQKEYFMAVKDKEFLSTFVKQPDLNHKVLYYVRHATEYNPYLLFEDNYHLTTSEMEDQLNLLFSKLDRLIPTDLDDRLYALFKNNNIDGYLLKYTNDPHIPSYESALNKVYTSDHILDLRMAVEIIKYHRINAVMTSSLRIIMQLIGYLTDQGYPEPLSFFFGTYFYNYDPETKNMKFMGTMNIVEYFKKYEFNIIDTFTELDILRRIEKGEQV